MKMTLKTILALMLAVSFTGLATVRAEEAGSSAAMEKTVQDLKVEQAHLAAIKEKLTALRTEKGFLTAYDVTWVLMGGFAAAGTKSVSEKYAASENKLIATSAKTAFAFSFVAYATVLTNLVHAGVDLKKVVLGDDEMQSIMGDIVASQERVAGLQEVLAKVTK
jgi:hypothetical protein